MVELARSMFREYDIRGRVDEEELNEKSFAAIMRGYADFLSKRGITKVVVGYDNRPHSVSFSAIACSLLSKRGFMVYDLGLTLSPAAYYAQYALSAPGVVMITASHNPLGWGGVKLGCGYSQTLGPREIEELYTLATKSSDGAGVKPGGEVRKIDLRPRYLQEIVKRVGPIPSHNLRVLLDSANGGAGLFVYELFQDLGCKTFQLNCDPDAAYPHYFPNPSSPQARKRMKELVKHPYIQADLALAFDGDGDRLGAVSCKGQDIWSDRLLIVLASEVLARCPGSPIIYDVKSSRALAEAISSLGGQGIMCPTGHSHVKAELRRRNSPLAGERSGHIFLGGDFYYGYDDALMAAACLVAIIVRRGKTLEELLSPYPCYYTTEEIAIPCPDSEKYAFIEKVKAALAQEWGQKRLNTINGVRLELPQGWVLLRASSNLPELVMVAEGVDEKSRAELGDLMLNQIQEQGLVIPAKLDLNSL